MREIFDFLNLMENVFEFVEELIDQFYNHHDKTHDFIIIIQIKQKYYHDRKYNKKKFNIKDLIILKFNYFRFGYKSTKSHIHKLISIGISI